MATIRCPVCERQFDQLTSEAMPFCSKRCQQIDLARWLGEKYSVPVERSEEDEEEGPSAQGNRRGED